MAQVTDIHRYPIKGLGVEELQSVTLAAGQPLPGDRAYAIAKADGRSTPTIRTGHRSPTSYS